MQDTEYDELTGLPNRKQLDKMLDRAVSRASRQHNMLAVMCLDLDDFKSINKTFGEAAGDAVLKSIAKILQDNVRKEECVARVAGDEFVLLIEDVKDIAHVDTIAQKIQNLFCDPIIVDGEKLLINLCMGIALFPVAGDTPEVLLKHADMALYAAKASGKDRFRYFTPEFNEKSDRHLQIAACLQTAVRDQEFYLNYSPIYDLHSNKIVAVEAVLNWFSGEFGPVPLSEFIPIAHETGMMASISLWELTTACEAFSSWDLEDFHLYITVTQSQFEGDDFIPDLENLIERLTLKPELIVLKISENLISDFNENHQEKLEKISELGFSISVDDYGTGASSLAQLKRTCVTSLKIDDSFTKNVGKDKEAESIIEASVKMAHCLDLLAIAEGVETDAQLTFLKVLGCDLAQGTYFTDALDADGFKKLIRQAS